MTPRQTKLVQQAAEVVAYQATSAPFTVARGLSEMAQNSVLQSECLPVFGMSFQDLDQGLRQLVDINKQYA